MERFELMVADPNLWELIWAKIRNLWVKIRTYDQRSELIVKYPNLWANIRTYGQRSELCERMVIYSILWTYGQRSEIRTYGYGQISELMGKDPNYANLWSYIRSYGQRS